MTSNVVGIIESFKLQVQLDRSPIKETCIPARRIRSDADDNGWVFQEYCVPLGTAVGLYRLTHSGYVRRSSKTER